MTTQVLLRSFTLPQRYFIRLPNGAYSEKSENVTVSYSETRIGNPVPAWEYKIRHLTSASSGYSRSLTLEVKPSNWSVSLSYPGDPGVYWEKLSGINHSSLPAKPLYNSKAYEIALGNFLSDASSAIAPLKGGVLVGELRETLRMIRNPASALRDGISAYLKRARRLRREHGRRNPHTLRKVLSNSWLEYVYGWVPLIEDLKSATEAYTKLKNKVETVRAFGKGSSGSKTPGVVGLGGHSNYIRYNQIVSLSQMTTCRIKGVCKADLQGVDAEAADRLQTALGFNIQDFLPTVWELIPYSFVVDMFTNIGDILNSGYGLTSDWVWTSKSELNESVKEVARYADLGKIAALTNGRAKVTEESGRPLVMSLKTYTRGIPQLRLPSLVFEIPSSPWSWANLAALISSKI